MAWDGEYLWVTNEGSRAPHDNYIFKVDPDTCTVIKSWRSSSYAECGATFDGEFLWTSGVHNPNGVQPPWDDPDAFELIYKYSIEEHNLSLVEMYDSPESYEMGIGNAIAFDGNGELWVTDGIGENCIKFMQLDIFPGVKTDFHEYFENIYKTTVNRSYTMDLQNWRVKGFEWVTWKDGTEEVIISGYTMSEGVPADTMYLCILDPANNFSMKRNYTWPVHDPSAIGTFGIAWDQENEVLWTCQAGSEKIYKHTRVSDKPYLIGFFEK